MSDQRVDKSKGGLDLASYTRSLLGGEDLRFWEILSISGFTTGFLLIAVYGHANGKLGLIFGILSLLGCAASLTGGVLGFLFGVPRLHATQAQNVSIGRASTFVPNTNLEQISDWLTKIIVGATLVQLAPLTDRIDLMAKSIGEALGTPGGAVASGAVMVLYFFGGFMWGYLWCSLRIFGEMRVLIEHEQAVAAPENLRPPGS